MVRELALEDSDFGFRAVSLFRGMNIYEALWAEPGITFKSLSVRFVRHPGGVPSDPVSRAEAHNSGLCTAVAAKRRRFVPDLLNLTPAGLDVNRDRKKRHDAAQWVPPMNRCRFAVRVTEVQCEYAVTVDAREANALGRVLSACASSGMIVRSCEGGWSVAAPNAPRSVLSLGTTDALRLWDNKGKGRITCREARHHGMTPVMRSHSSTRSCTMAMGWSAGNRGFLVH